MTRGGRFLSSGRDRPVAAVYRGPIASPGCAEAVAELLRTCPSRYRVHYLGPDEDHDICTANLFYLDLFAWPGGGDDERSDYQKVAHYTEAIEGYVRQGGVYGGFCLGAFLARGPEEHTFFKLLPDGCYVDGERFQSNAQVKHSNDTVVLTDWVFHAGSKKGKVQKDCWQYFQDGGRIYLTPEVSRRALILGSYACTKNPCAVVLSHGRGYVGLIGVHPEADASWYEGFHNPQGISHEIGYDFIETLREAQASSRSASASSRPR